ncbi:MAG: hypothetical protein E6778_14790 [Niallia nealsonii]|nr:hypothetical protein [Niallia nealsonii]
MAKKNVVILIVEGISDERALSSIRRYVKDTFGIHIHLTNGDIFSDYTKRKSIKALVGDQVQKVMEQYKYTRNEILAVIQVTDTDGVFIKDECIIIDENMEENLKYHNDSIHVSNQENAVKSKQRNKFKASNLKAMYSANKVQKTLDYHLLYFSCNLDHVIHNECNLVQTEKDPKAKKFDRLYKDKPNDFIEFFKNEEFAVNGTLLESWQFIQEDTHSLERYSNFHHIFNILDLLIKK